MKRLLLASTSVGRRELLQRLGLPFDVCRPRYREVPCPGVAAAELAQRHALGKARSVAAEHPGCVVIGSDQVACVAGELLGKPGTRDAAIAQLTRMAGQWVDFYTGLAVLDAQRQLVCTERFRVRLRTLTAAEVAAYVAAELPLACAGSFRIEGLGIALMQELEGRDYTALIGLPLIALCDALRQVGVDPLQAAVRSSGSGV